MISTQKEKTAAEVKMIATQSEATALKTAADNENQRKIDASKAIAEALRIDTHAKAEVSSYIFMGILLLLILMASFK